MRTPKEKACLLGGTESCAMVGSAWVDQGQAGSLARACRVFTGQSLMRTGAGPWCWWGGLKCLRMLRGEEFALCSLSGCGGWGGGGGLCPAGGAGRSVPQYKLCESHQPSGAQCGTRKLTVCFAWGLPKQPKTHW